MVMVVDASEDNLSNYNSSNSDYSRTKQCISIPILVEKVVFSFQSMKMIGRYLVRVADEDGGNCSNRFD
jgi:hypothetical protein